MCVELDTGSIFSGYEQYIPEFNSTLAKNEYNLDVSLHTEDTRITSDGTKNGFDKGDGVLGVVNGQVVNFPLPQPDLFGYCNSFNGPSFLVDSVPKSCVQSFQDLSQACSTIMNPQWRLNNQVYIKGSSMYSDRGSLSFKNLYSFSIANDNVTRTSSLG